MEIFSIDYNYLTYDYNGLVKTISEDEFEKFYVEEEASFDLIMSISSVDHSGLGRYGDQLNPNGDISAMRQTLSLLRPGGFLMLTVPIGPDLIVFNTMRRYGKFRLPLLLSGWDVVDKLDWDERR